MTTHSKKWHCENLKHKQMYRIKYRDAVEGSVSITFDGVFLRIHSEIGRLFIVIEQNDASGDVSGQTSIDIAGIISIKAI